MLQGWHPQAAAYFFARDASYLACASGRFSSRYGGEEFVAVLDCGREGALLMPERMRHRIEALQIADVHSVDSSVVPASLGVASTENTCAQSAEALLAAADEALHKAKASCRNAVLAAEEQL